MASPVPSYRRARVAGQAMIVLLALGLAGARPAAGRLLLVPLDGRPAARTFALALDHRLLPLAAGPLPGSLIVRGAYGRSAGAMLGQGVLTLPAPAGGCEGGRAA